MFKEIRSLREQFEQFNSYVRNHDLKGANTAHVWQSSGSGSAQFLESQVWVWRTAGAYL